ncbi:hypothetical protein RhiJN_08743 [Ceratobasidium sp. AG-Ba]|nr:hypothetical protein RhiJN_08743 [Ceratobasidium sp. AG-Ba]QRW09526.1 hypothetical protein RhiLY_08525 [Ceratobasidium sp. AG-Ba]
MKHVNGLYIFSKDSLPYTQTFCQQLKKAMSHKDFDFSRVAVFATREPEKGIAAAFAPAIKSIRQSWGDRRPFQESLIDCLMLDRWYSSAVVAVADEQKLVIVVKHNFERYGWTLSVPLASCECDVLPTGPPSRKRWTFKQVNNAGAPTALTLCCSGCGQSVLMKKPDDAPTLSHACGGWYRR